MSKAISKTFHETVRKALVEVDRRLADGTLDGSGRFYTDEQLAAGAATGRKRDPDEPAKAPAA